MFGECRAQYDWFCVDSAASGHNHSETMRDMKSSSAEKTQPDTKHTIHSSSCLKDNMPALPVSATSKRKVGPGFKITISGQVI